ncbi:CS1 type fimbrial major subunit [Enterobacteriaceae bacterium C34A]
MKKVYLASVMFMAVFSVQAAPQIDFNIEATVPDSEFYVNSNNGWDANTQKMTWNSATNTLNTLTQQLVMKNSAGGIKAYLASQPALSNSESTDNIDLKVSIAGNTLPTDAASAVTLFSDTQAKTEKTVTMQVSPANSNTPAPGNYMGSVTMMFDNVIPD